MDYIPVPQAATVELLYRQDGQIVENVLGFRFASVTSQTISDLTGLAAAVKSWWTTNLQPIVHSAVSLYMIRATDISSQSGPVVEYTTGLPAVGATGADPMPNSVTIVYKAKTALRGRSYRGRIYHVGLAESHVTGNIVVSTQQTALQAAYTALLATMAGYNYGIISRQLNGVKRTTGVITPVVSLSSDGVIDSQRRRLPGRGS